MKITEIRKLSTDDLTKKSNELQVQINDLRRKLHLGEITNVRSVRLVRKDLARVLTVLAEKLSKEVS